VAPDDSLLGWALNFAGATGNEGGALYALKGIVGLYQGFYSIGPYYQKVKEYGDWENRDIWEYRLALAPEEIEGLLMHLWELQGIAFDYYYFDENCSYQLLALLEAVRPELRLTARFPLWVIPADTVRAVVRQSGLLESVRYRPSAATELGDQARELPRAQRRLARLLAEGAVAPDDSLLGSLPERERAAVLTVAYDSLRYAYLAGEVERDESASRARGLLVARSRVAVTGSPFPAVPVPALRPDQGHGTARVAVAGGQRDGRSFLEARIRPAFHDLLDPEGGYTRGAQIQFLDLALRIFPEDGRVRLHEATLLDMVSLVPWDPFFRHPSFAFDTGLRTRLMPDGEDRSDRDPEAVWRTRGAVGLSAGLGPKALAYALAEGTADLGGALDDDFGLGVGAAAGCWLGGPADRWRGHLFGRVSRFVLGDVTPQLRAGVEQRISLTRNLALAAEAAYARDFGSDWLELGLRWNLYF
jgi:hypothetical protein